MSDLRLKLPAAALEPELARYFDTVDAAAPAPMRPADGEDAIEAGALELGEGVRFLPLHVAEDASAAFIAAIVTASLIAGVGAGALTIAAGFDVTTVALAILAVLAALFPWELGEKVDPFAAAPAGIKPEWYFLFMFQALKKLPAHILGIEGEVIGILFFGICFGVVLLVPFLDRGPRSRRTLVVLAWSAVVFFLVMTAWGLIE